jgi:hypothetical protein
MEGATNPAHSVRNLDATAYRIKDFVFVYKVFLVCRCSRAGYGISLSRFPSGLSHPIVTLASNMEIYICFVLKRFVLHV